MLFEPEKKNEMAVSPCHTFKNNIPEVLVFLFYFMDETFWFLRRRRFDFNNIIIVSVSLFNIQPQNVFYFT